ncbi:TetR/AcrR family transcriptional regulator [Actinoallomurus rhizosphaericola]|uniref:TetR/AcrR family transcriptional regulator n=1 Tax=Actinoallomurus rhizosphaericola TaxID=2952536 RepID=UPI002091ED32|nr:TetR/AcrR family transcriptional regulator [Actinoallomurus rhizosphaericola]MCO5998337.1 TetR/AcrR family transcriptional regulator [Actinoallomurus rhizosphaericola]
MTAPRRASATDGGRPVRADALRNRARVLEAAEAVFAEHGTTASTEQVARRAGLGVGTVFRHFPTKEALLEAVFVARLDRLATEADGLMSAEDPGEAFFGFFARVVGHAATKNALSAALAEAGVDVRESTAETGRELRRALGALLGRAQEAGAVRPDVGLPEILTLLVGASQAAEHVGGDAEVWTRALAVVFDGLRAAPAGSDPGSGSPGVRG